MIQIDMDMPRSCAECPFQEETYHGCPLVPGVPAWQAEIADECKDKRSEHCPLKEQEKRIETLETLRRIEQEGRWVAWVGEGSQTAAGT